MRLGVRIRSALVVGLFMAAVLSRHESAIAQQTDGKQGTETGKPVSLRVTDLDLDWHDATFAALQPPDEDQPGVPSQLALAEPARGGQPDGVPPRPQGEPSRPDPFARFAALRRRPLASVPHMYGDFFGGGTGQAVVTMPPISVVVTDGPFNLLVTNAGGTNGANSNPAVPIRVWGGPTGSLLVTTSIGNGLDLSGDGQPDTYPVGAPNAPGVLPPAVPGGPLLVYTGGNAVYADAHGNPADGSVGQGDGWSLVANYAWSPNQVIVNVPYGGASVRRVKIADNTSPEPRDRLFFNFNFFRDVIGGLGDVSQYTFGCERTFWDGSGSLEVRVPFAATLAGEQTVGVEARDVEFGNVAAWFKAVLYEIPTGLISAGLGVAAPTGSSTRVLIGQTPILQIENQAVHLLPFLGAMSTPRERWFWQGFLQLDVNTNGDPVRGDVTGRRLSQFGVLQDATLLFADAGVGYALYENADTRGLTRFSPTAELHYSTTLQDTDVAAGNGFLIRSPTPRFDVLNLTLGASFLWNERLWIRPAMVLPLRDDGDRHFDYEAMLQIDWLL
jgi:hypothetical protein